MIKKFLLRALILFIVFYVVVLIQGYFSDLYGPVYIVDCGFMLGGAEGFSEKCYAERDRIEGKFWSILLFNIPVSQVFARSVYLEVVLPIAWSILVYVVGWFIVTKYKTERKNK